MLAEEGGQQALQLSIAVARESVTVAGHVTSLTKESLGQLMRLATTGLSQAKSAMLDTGQMSVKRLQRLSGGDLQSKEISPELLRSVKADLRRRGISFSVEKAADGKTYVHFSGRDVDSVRHSLKQAGARLGTRAPLQQTRSVRQSPTRAAQAARPRTKRQVLSGIQRRQRSIVGTRHAAPAPRISLGHGAR